VPSPRSDDGRYGRVLLKLSGAAFKGSQAYGIDAPTVVRIGQEVKEVSSSGTEVGVVVGGGNIWRGSAPAAEGMDRVTADNMGMIATVINALALQDALERMQQDTRVQTAIEMREVAEPFIWRRAIRHLEKGRVVIMAAGSGHPFFTTDTAAVLRAIQIGAEVILKATDVDGVYDRHPDEPGAVLLKHVSYLDAISQRLKVMDATALSLAMEHNLPIVVFNIQEPQSICRAARCEEIGTLVQ
jgi:uridylate kinase